MRVARLRAERPPLNCGHQDRTAWRVLVAVDGAPEHTDRG